MRLLSKGLSFCPTPWCANRDDILNYVESYFRRLRLKEFFLNEDKNNDAEPHSQFRPPSTWMPPKGGDATLEIYIRKFRADVQNQLQVNHLK